VCTKQQQIPFQWLGKRLQQEIEPKRLDGSNRGKDVKRVAHWAANI
jgi:hypothetical protein